MGSCTRHMRAAPHGGGAPETSDSDAAEATRPEKSSYSYLQLRNRHTAKCQLPRAHAAVCKASIGRAWCLAYLLKESATILTPSCGCTTASGLELHAR